MKKLLPILLLVSIFLNLLGGCSIVSFEQELRQPASQVKTPQVLHPPFLMPKIDIAASDREIDAFWSTVKKLVDTRDFRGLEERAKFYANNKERFIGGGWKVTSVSAAIREIGNKSIHQLIDFLKDWLETSPDSILARSLLVSAHIDYAWEARGDDYVHLVSYDNLRIFKERMEEAEKAFKYASELSERCHQFFAVALELGRAQSWDKKRYDTIFEEAVKFEPTYQYFYTAKAVSLMPRWGGKPGEWERFASDVMGSIGGEDGLKMYYVIVADVAELKTEAFFRDNNVSWADTKEGFRLYAIEHGMTRYKMSSFAILARKAKDTKVTCSAFKELSIDNYETSLWKDRATFERAKQDAELMCRFPEADNQAK